MPFGVFCVHHRALCHQPRRQDFCFYRLKVGVATGSVHNGVKLRMQWHDPAAGRNAKIWSVGLAVHGDVVESTGILSGGRQYPANTLDRAQVSMVERIGSTYRSVARAICLPWAKRSTGKDVPYRLGIGQVRIKVHRTVGPNARHLQALDVKFKWQLPWSERIDYQLRFVADKAINENLYLSSLGPHVFHLDPLFSGRQILLQSLYIDRLDTHGRAKKILDSHPESEFCDADERLYPWLVMVGVTVAEESQPFARDLEPLNQRDIKCIKLNFALEPSRQSLDHPRAQDGPGVINQNAHRGADDGEDDNE